MPFFCSDRYANQGCGRTYSLLYTHHIHASNICAVALLTLIGKVASGSKTHKAWSASRSSFSITTAYRFIRRWRAACAHIRSTLSRTRPPPQHSHHGAEHTTWLHLQQDCHTPGGTCCITVFQTLYQQHFLP